MKNNDNSPTQQQTFIQGPSKVRNKRAEALLRTLKRSPNVEQPHKALRSPVAKQRVLRAGGIESTASRMKGRSKFNTDIHDLEFHRVTADPGDSYEPRKNISKSNAKLRQDNIKYQMGQLMDEVKYKDTIEAQPIESESGRNPRARMYDRLTKGALKSQKRQLTKNYSMDEINAVRGEGNDWINPANKGKVVKFDPKELKKPLIEAAKGKIISRLAGPQVQAAMMADELAGAALGERPSVTVGKGFKKYKKKEIEERLKRGERVIPMGLAF